MPSPAIFFRFFIFIIFLALLFALLSWLVGWLFGIELNYWIRFQEWMRGKKKGEFEKDFKQKTGEPTFQRKKKAN